MLCLEDPTIFTIWVMVNSPSFREHSIFNRRGLENRPKKADNLAQSDSNFIYYLKIGDQQQTDVTIITVAKLIK